MKTWQAALVHIGLGAAQTAAAVPFFSSTTTHGALANTGIQIGAQFGLMLLQILAAKVNSNSDPNGNALAQNSSTGNFQSVVK